MDTDLHGAVLRRIDPATNQPTDTSIPMPSANGYLRTASDGSALVFQTNTDALFLAAGATAFRSLESVDPNVFAVSQGAWAWTSDTNTATLTGPNGAITVLPETFPVLGADAQAIYADGGPGSPATSTLWRYPVDGSPGRQIASGATVPRAGGTTDLDYYDDWPFVIGQHVAVKLWLPLSPNANGDRALEHPMDRAALSLAPSVGVGRRSHCDRSAIAACERSLADQAHAVEDAMHTRRTSRRS